MVIVVGRKVRKMWRRMYGVEVGGGEHWTEEDYSSEEEKNIVWRVYDNNL